MLDIPAANFLELQAMQRLSNAEDMMATFNPDNVGAILFLAEAGAMGGSKGSNTPCWRSFVTSALLALAGASLPVLVP